MNDPVIVMGTVCVLAGLVGGLITLGAFVFGMFYERERQRKEREQ